MMIIGLTGGIATGKSTVAATFRKYGIHIIDFDVLARVVVEPDTPAWNDIVDFFGSSVLRRDRTLDRPRLGEMVFTDAAKRKTLEGFIYPRLFEEYSRCLAEINQCDQQAIIMADVPLLIESGMEGMFEKIIIVYASREQQIERLTVRDGLDLESALRRLEAQMPIEEKLKYADFVVRNCGSISEVEAEVEKICESLFELNAGE